MVTPHGWGLVLVVIVAAVVGAAGGVLAELLQTRGTITGALELPGHIEGRPNLLELGLLSSVILGAGAGVAILYFIPPTVTINGDTSYDVVKGVALTLLAGSFGRTVLTSLQARLIASLKDQQARSTADVAATQLERQAKGAEADAVAAVRQAVAGHVDPDKVDQIAQSAAAAVAVRAQGRADDAKNAVAAVAP
ncbi:MAG TPA: hypothetical protein VGH45_03820 [Solirubrobacteraceae bacterium]